jgi:uncharacterized membrane protein YgcG
VAAGVAAIAILAASVTAALASEIPPQNSTNWAGYVATSAHSTRGLAKRFTSVSGTWVEPSATCTASQRTFSAFWVGLGGYYANSRALEQIGSEADCSSDGETFYYAWYELVPAGAVNIRMEINPGDTIHATVNVAGEHVTVTLADLTSGAPRFVKHLLMKSPRPDTSAAEWIAEAPSNCNSRNDCTLLPLTDFGSVSFTSASARSVGIYGHHHGPIDDPAWMWGAISLQPLDQNGQPTSVGSASATPAALSGGNAFAVSYSSGASGPTGPSGSSGSSGSSGASGSS